MLTLVSFNDGSHGDVADDWVQGHDGRFHILLPEFAPYVWVEHVGCLNK